MLTTLRVRNLALVEDLTIEFPPGLVVVTGETGAGKSIILGALNLILGDRADRSLIRAGAEACTVEAVFDVRTLRFPLAEWIESNGSEPCEESQLRLKRTFTASGANRQFINGSATSLARLAEIGEWLVDMHGPHDHQSLLSAPRQLALLDAFANLGPAVAAFAERVTQRAALLSAKAALVVDDRTYAQQLDLLRFQAQEIEGAQLLPGEEPALEAEHHRASNAARLIQSGQAALNALAEDETSVMVSASAVGRALAELRRVDPGAETLASLHEQAVASLNELQTELSRYVDHVEVDPARLQTLEERLDLIHGLKRKYGSTLEEVIRFGADSRQRLELLEGREAEVARLEAELKRAERDLTIAGAELTASRRGAIPRLAKAVSGQLADLGFRQGRFEIALASTSPREARGGEPWRAVGSGFDTVEFQFAPNPGEPARALRAIASSGEMARVMLAVKTVLAVEDEIPVLVFDEVDANVGGETAVAVGEKMRQIARRRQVFCVTHLPQVAAAGATHFVVTKQVRDGRTNSEIHRVDEKERVTEIARMLGSQTDSAARKHALALLKG